MPDLLLLSNSRAPGMGFLEHAADAIAATLGGRDRLLFVPFASGDHDTYTTTMRRAMAGLDVQVTSLHEVDDATRAVRDAEAVFVGGGNSFRLLRTLNRLGVLDVLRRAVTGGIPYLGASAGSNLVCPSIRTTNDMPIVEVPALTALGLIPFQLNPHYLDPDPRSAHQGETRPQRIEEFLDENDIPVLGLREGSWLQVSGQQAILSGASTGRLFRREAPPAEVPAGTDLSFLLQTTPRFDTTRGFELSCDADSPGRGSMTHDDDVQRVSGRRGRRLAGLAEPSVLGARGSLPTRRGRLGPGCRGRLGARPHRR
jgi:dipeptidase E